MWAYLRLKGRSQLQGRDMKDTGGGERGTSQGSEQVGRDKIHDTEKISPWPRRQPSSTMIEQAERIGVGAEAAAGWGAIIRGGSHLIFSR